MMPVLGLASKKMIQREKGMKVRSVSAVRGWSIPPAMRNNWERKVEQSSHTMKVVMETLFFQTRAPRFLNPLGQFGSASEYWSIVSAPYPNRTKIGIPARKATRKSAHTSSLVKKGKPIPHLHNPENYKKTSTSLKRVMGPKWKDPDYRSKLLSHLSELNNCPEQKLNCSKGGRAVWSKHGDKLRQHLRELHSQQTTEFYRENGLKGLKVLHAYPNKQESQLFEILKAISSEWQYIGDGKVPVGNLRPDFINGRLIIEFFGEYWHKLEDVIKKQETYAEHGYELLVIWSRELKDKEVVINKIKGFMEVNYAC